MSEKAEQLLINMLKEITPTAKRRTQIEALARKLEKKVTFACERSGVKAKVRVEGSVAKDTWLSEEPDIDIFMRVPKSIPRASLGDVCLRVARLATRGSEQIERFAEHPYLEAKVDGTTVNVVPCYAVKRGQWLSATDRTPFHTDYVKQKLNMQLKSEVRLLKKFLKGIGVYGAEIKVGGLSGYLCELLILHYGSFMNALKAFAQHKRRIIIDIERFYENRENEINLLFDEPLVVVDPVDKARNVASAVRSQRLYNFTAAARAFLKTPSHGFFDPLPSAPLAKGEAAAKLKKRGSKMVFLTFGKVDAVPDVLWGQLYKSMRSLHKLVELNDFSVLRDFAWSDEKGLNMFVFELEDCCIPLVKKHLGPPLEKESECEKFLSKHQNGQNTVSGPYVEDGRWVVLVRRKFRDACVLLQERLRDGGKNAGVADQISQVLRKKGFSVLVNEEIAETYEKNREFAQFLTEFFSGLPKWLRTGEAQH